ncbi:hypothetical protein CJD36_015335 [Flavipsychrobacter stenotrophus]|uniref:Uncharacterized protein n=1 Tax=Flavipsychrobacter stenotrophus TaxID=2077091 RepID=A0A2S7ST24_9BACT|nr:hypothetical protein [Flavipsychrobacter stenotrophus]PQJ10070.1 hypothetical protein CJD36_015335 [Flavipsychrobacter stenotrophus]
MEDGFSIDIEYNGEVLSFDVRLATTGYTHNFMVIINSIEVTYEPDEERNYRAIVNAETAHSLKDKDKMLIGLVGAKLDELKYL